MSDKKRAEDILYDLYMINRADKTNRTYYRTDRSEKKRTCRIDRTERNSALDIGRIEQI